MKFMSFASLCAVSFLFGSLYAEESAPQTTTAALADPVSDGKKEIAADPAPSKERMDDLKCILHKMFLAENCEPLLTMMAGEAITESQKTMDSQELIQKFRLSFDEEKVLGRFCAPYDGVFSDQEIHQLKEIHESPVYEKFSKQGVKIFQSNFATMKETFKEL